MHNCGIQLREPKTTKNISIGLMLAAVAPVILFFVVLFVVKNININEPLGFAAALGFAGLLWGAVLKLSEAATDAQMGADNAKRKLVEVLMEVEHNAAVASQVSPTMNLQYEAYKEHQLFLAHLSPTERDAVRRGYIDADWADAQEALQDYLRGKGVSKLRASEFAAD